MAFKPSLSHLRRYARPAQDSAFADVHIFCTGFRLSLPFFSPEVQLNYYYFPVITLTLTFLPFFF